MVGGQDGLDYWRGVGSWGSVGWSFRDRTKCEEMGARETKGFDYSAMLLAKRGCR